LVFKDEKGLVINEITGTTNGNKRLLTFTPIRAQSVSLLIDEQRLITRVGEFNAFYYKVD
jgi:hypothetical protein